jgi:hypothetical protein
MRTLGSSIGTVAWCVAATGAAAVDVPLTDKTVIQFADERVAADRLGQVDTFIDALSPFDRAARVRSERPVSREEFLRFVAAQARPWSEDEVGTLTETIESVRAGLAPYAAHFPERILLVKTTGNEEGNAAYCRHDNVIVLPQKLFNDSPRPLGDLLLHELFHILSRNNRELRDSLYGTVGFTPCSPIELPESLRPRKITNPDAPVIEHYLKVEADGKTVAAVPILFSRTAEYDPASGRTFFAYLTFRLLAIERGGAGWQPVRVGDEPWLLDVSEVPGFFDQIGRNTGYIIHPEEVLADNFVLLVNGKRDVPSPEILERMERLLTAR